MIGVTRFNNTDELARIRTVEKIIPLNARNLYCVVLSNGRGVVVHKETEYLVGDKVVYIEPGAALPMRAEWCNFMKKYGWLVAKRRIHGYVSNGQVYPLAILPKMKVEEGMLVGDMIGLQFGFYSSIE